MPFNYSHIEIQKFIERNSIFLLLFLILDLSFVMHLVGPIETLDTKLFYSGEQARIMLDSLSNSNLEKYFLNEVFDLGLIASYTAIFILSLRRLYPKKRWTWLLPTIVGFSDLVETSTILACLKYSNLRSHLDWLGLFTASKWTLGTVVVAFILLGISKARSRHKKLYFTAPK